jgi:hypothetical protein
MGLLRCWIALGLAICCVSSCIAQYHLIPGKTDESTGCDPKTPARICLGTGTVHCYAPESTDTYIFGMEPKAVRVGQLAGQPLILFSAMFYGCGSGTLTDYSLLTIKKGELVNLLPKVQLTNQSEYKFWSLTQVSRLPVLVTADFIWDFGNPKDPNDQGETHFAAHRYAIDVFEYNSKSGRYEDIVDYSTKKKYAGLDDVDEIRVIEPERSVILSKLRSVPKGPESK